MISTNRPDQDCISEPWGMQVIEYRGYIIQTRRRWPDGISLEYQARYFIAGREFHTAWHDCGENTIIDHVRTTIDRRLIGR